MSETSDAVKSAVMEWLDKNKDAVMENIKVAARDSIDTVSVAIGAQIAEKAGQWMDKNTKDLKHAFMAQLTLGSMEPEKGE